VSEIRGDYSAGAETTTVATSPRLPSNG
jgi:hypothetical protein